MNTDIPDNAERASRAEMLFAGHYLNLFGVLLLLTGLTSYLKSAVGASTGLPQTLLGGALGVFLLIAGELFYRKGQQFFQPLVMGGYTLLFLVASAAHFRYELTSQTGLFLTLLPLVVGSVASAFRYDSKLIGNAMLVVFFFAPVFVTFSFSNFWAIFFYLLAINLGSALVAFYKRWDFQLLMAALGSYTLYFAHFRTETASRSLLVLFVIYGLSLLANNVLHFLRKVDSDYNLVLSFINPTVFAALSAVTILGLPNWARVSVYATLAGLHLALAIKADQRRAENSTFLLLATSNLSLSLLFSWAAISFVTYFSDNTAYFGLVTLLMFVLALGLQLVSFELPRHSRVLCRFSYFGIVLAVAQVVYVLPSMQGSGWLQLASLALYGAYFLVFLKRREGLSFEQGLAFKVTGVGGAVFFVNTVSSLASPSVSILALGTLALASLTLPLGAGELREFRVLPHLFTAAVGWQSLQAWESQGLGNLALPLFVLALGVAIHKALKSGRQVEFMWYWVGVLATRAVLPPLSGGLEFTILALAVCHLTLVGAAGRVNQGRRLGQSAVLPSMILAYCSLVVGPDLMPTLAGSLAILALSHLAAYRHGASLTGVDLALQVAVLARVGAGAYQPYPATCLVLCGLIAAGLSRFKLTQFSVALYGLVCVGSLALSGGASGSLAAWSALLFIPTTFLPGYIWSRGSQASVAIAAFGSLALMRLSLGAHIGPVSTLLWALLATVFLRERVQSFTVDNWNDFGQGIFDVSRILYFTSFVKAICFDANFVGRPDLLHYPAAFGLGGLFLLSAHLWVAKREVRNVFVVLGLLIFCFQLTFLAHGWWGDRMVFQPVLSGFWSLVGFLVVAVGVVSKVKIYRLFGLTTLVGNTVKILLVDIHVLDSYSKTNTYLILGALLIMTSLLYQRQKDRLLGVSSVGAPEPVAL